MAPPSLPNDDDGERAVTGAPIGSSAGSQEALTGDDRGPGVVGGTDDYPADGSTPARGDSVPRDD
ncbi:hypothetical protein [Sphingomonas sp.]|uniref:hypothetical protein n=1 Tax=Sphingomonas sp. TaxID=28214 RepID=UPI0035ADF31F